MQVSSSEVSAGRMRTIYWHRTAPSGLKLAPTWHLSGRSWYHRRSALLPRGPQSVKGVEGAKPVRTA